MVKIDKREENEKERAVFDGPGSLFSVDSAETENVGMENHVQVFYRAIIRASDQPKSINKIDINLKAIETARPTLMMFVLSAFRPTVS